MTVRDCLKCARHSLNTERRRDAEVQCSFRPPELQNGERLLWDFSMMTPKINCLLQHYSETRQLFNGLTLSLWCIILLNSVTLYFAATFPATVQSQFKLHLKERQATNEIKCKPTQSAAADLLLNESHATANVSLLACLQKLLTATLDIKARIQFHSTVVLTSLLLGLLWKTLTTRTRLQKASCEAFQAATSSPSLQY